jgi:hypothetical protein
MLSEKPVSAHTGACFKGNPLFAAECRYIRSTADKFYSQFSCCSAAECLIPAGPGTDAVVQMQGCNSKVRAAPIADPRDAVDQHRRVHTSRKANKDRAARTDTVPGGEKGFNKCGKRHIRKCPGY